MEQKILTPHQILKGLDEQRKWRRYIPLLLVDQGALPDYRALRYCTQADENHEDFLEVLLAEGLISQQQCALIRAAWIRSGPHLGRLLVNMGYMNEATLLAALEEFEPLKACEEDRVRIPSVPPVGSQGLHLRSSAHK